MFFFFFQAEDGIRDLVRSRGLGDVYKRQKFLDACESGDPHTAVARIMWPNLSWTGDLKRDKLSLIHI